MQKWWRNCPATNGSPMYIFQQKLKHIKEKIKKWNKDLFGNIMSEKLRLEQQIEEIKS